MEHIDSPWLRHEEVESLVSSIADERMRTFLRFGLTTILTKRGLSDKNPSAPFDLCFFAEVLCSMFERKEVLESIVSGDLEQFSWWPDDE